MIAVIAGPLSVFFDFGRTDFSRISPSIWKLVASVLTLAFSLLAVHKGFPRSFRIAAFVAFIVYLILNAVSLISGA